VGTGAAVYQDQRGRRGAFGRQHRLGDPEGQPGEYFINFVKKQGHGRDRSWDYYKRVKQLQDPTGSEGYKRFDSTIGLFRKYGEQYGFDPLLLAAQGYQESQLNQEARSHVGAIGIMQIMPSTGAELRVGDIKIAESNVHAGTKYMDRLMTRYFGDATFSELDRSLFAFASYNARAGQHLTHAPGNREARPRWGQVVQQRGDRRRREDRHRDDDVRAEHLQVLHLVQATQQPS
jgi:Transglycosylase SLT domain